MYVPDYYCLFFSMCIPGYYCLKSIPQYRAGVRGVIIFYFFFFFCLKSIPQYRAGVRGGARDCERDTIDDCFLFFFLRNWRIGARGGAGGDSSDALDGGEK